MFSVLETFLNVSHQHSSIILNPVICHHRNPLNLIHSDYVNMDRLSWAIVNMFLKKETFDSMSMVIGIVIAF